MADAKKCDRCGDLYEMYDGIKFEKAGLSYNHIHALTNYDRVHRTFDLCPTCMNKLINFLLWGRTSQDNDKKEKDDGSN